MDRRRRQPSKFTAASGARRLAWLLLALLCACSPGTRPPPSVILISIDTLRVFDVGDYGYTRPTTPQLDRFASESLVFRDAVSNSNNTLVSHASMLTSRYRSAHGAQPGSPIPPSLVTLAESLQAAGYDTAFFAAHGDWLSRRYGFDQGFQEFKSDYVSAEQINAWAFDWLGEGRERPFFLALHYYDAHSDFAHQADLPYLAPPGFAGRFTAGYRGDFTGCDTERKHCASDYLRQLSRAGIQLSEADRAYIQGLYDEGLLYTDAMVGRVLDRLRELSLYDDALIVITSDHGEEFQEHGSFLHLERREPVARVPLWIRLPGGEPHGEVQALAEGVDLYPTILDVLGLPSPPGLQGESLLALARGAPARSDWALIDYNVLRSSRWKSLRDESGRRVLYDLERDPGEERDVAAEHPELLREIGARIREANRPQVRHTGAESLPLVIDPEERQRLEALGYELAAPED